jgi:putative endonuclease
VFVEVRARRNPRFAGAAASVDWRKQQRILRTAQVFLQQRREWSNMSCRFDVIAFEPRQSEPGTAIRWVRAAFTN